MGTFTAKSDELTAADRIIWSADVPDMEALLRFLDQMPELDIVKIDRLFAERNGLGAVSELQERGLRVFDDAKIIEIPSKIVEIASVHLMRHPWMLNCMAGGMSTGNVGRLDDKELDGLKRFADACHAAGTRPCGVTVLTSKSEGVVASEFNGRTSVEQVLYYVEALFDAGFTDVVCSPQEVAAIRAESRFATMDLNTPGVRLAGKEGQDDQARTNTPSEAILAGATRVVAGRPLTEGDPAENYRQFAADIESAA